MFLEVIEANHIEGFKIELKFNNGETKVADLSNAFIGEVYKPLNDIQYFKNFRINFNTIEWPNGADFAPEYLYSISNKK